MGLAGPSGAAGVSLPAQAMVGGTAEFWCLRHGERVDETPEGHAWKKSSPRARRFDPPLTAQGKAQAREAARVLMAQAGTFARVFSSPLQRALETAQEVAETFNIPVTVVPGLCECAAAVRKRGIRGVELLSLEAMQRVCSRIDTVEEEAPLDFGPACAWLAERNSRCLAVSHREGIRELAAEQLKLPYCAMGHFAYEAGDWGLQSINTIDAPPSAPARVLRPTPQDDEVPFEAEGGNRPRARPQPFLLAEIPPFDPNGAHRRLR